MQSKRAPPTPAATPMTMERWRSIQDVISRPTEPPSQTPY